MNVLFVSSYGEFGIGEPIPYIKSQSESLKKAGICVTDYYLKERGIIAYIKFYFRLKRFLNKNKNINIIHAHFVYIAFLVYLTKAKSKLIVSFMGDDLYGGVLNNKHKRTLKSVFNIHLSKFMQRKVDWIIVKSDRMLTYIDENYKHKTSVIPNGVDFNKFPIKDYSECKLPYFSSHSKV